MKNRIEKKFADLKKIRRKAFIAFLTAGDPHLRWTPRIALELEKAGVDILELGMPFSDPMADGPVIQKSSERSLRAGTSLKGVLEAVRRIRKQSQIPLLLMGYYNPILHYGLEKFFLDARGVGVDGVLLVDLPPEEGEGLRQAAQKNGISRIYLLAPTSGPERIAVVRCKASGFIYYVSLTGITGAKIRQDLRSQKALQLLLKGRKLPVCVGFGIKTPTQARQVAQLADGVVVGSALVSFFEKYPAPVALKKAAHLAKSLAAAVHSVS